MSERMWFHVIYEFADDDAVYTALVFEESFGAAERFVRDDIGAQEWWIGLADKDIEKPSVPGIKDVTP